MSVSHFFPFGRQYLRNRLTDLHQNWHAGGYYQGLYESWKPGWSVTLCGFYIIKTAFKGDPPHLQSPISQQPLARFLCKLAWWWVLHLAFPIPKTTIIGCIERNLRIKTALSVCPSRFHTSTFRSLISRQPLGRFAPKLARWWILSRALWILKTRMIGHIMRILYYKNCF